MKKMIYRSLATLAFVLVAATSAQAQMKTSYFMEGSLPRYELNPALTPQNSYFRFAFGGINVNVNNRLASFDKLLYPGQNGKTLTFMHPSVDAGKFLKSLSWHPNLGMNFNYNLFGFGRYASRSKYFWSVDFNIRTEVDVTLPKELFEIMKNFGNGVYPIDDMEIDAMVYSELALGFAMPVGWENLVVGGRLKFLMGHAHAGVTFDNMNLNVGEDEISATAAGRIQTNFPGMDMKGAIGERQELGDVLDFGLDNFGGRDVLNGYGAAIDLGAEMKLLDERLKVSLALNDLGFIRWGARNALQGEMDEIRADFRGYNTGDDDFDVTKPDEIMVAKTGNNAYTKRLSTTLNIGAEYTFLDDLLGVGVLSRTRFGRIVTYSDLTITGTVRPARWFTAAISQTVTRNRLGAVGFALNFHPRGFNFFLGADYLPTHWARIDGIPLPRSAKSLNFYTGISFGLGGRSKPW